MPRRPTMIAVALLGLLVAAPVQSQDVTTEETTRPQEKAAASDVETPAKKETDNQVAPVQRKAPAKAKAAEPANPAARTKAAAKSDGAEAGDKAAPVENAEKAERPGKSDDAGKGDAAPKAAAAAEPKDAKDKPALPRKAAAKVKPVEAEPAGAPLASCEELKNDNGLRIVVYAPSAKSARLAIFDRGSNKELEKDLFSASLSSATSYARILWGTRNTPKEKLLKGAFLISASEKDKFFEGMLMADGGDGSFLVHRAHLGKPEEDRKRWILTLGAEQRTLSCRMGS